MDIGYAMQLGVDVFGDYWLEALTIMFPDQVTVIDIPIIQEEASA